MTWFAVLVLVWLLVAALARRAHERGSARMARRWTTRLYAVTLVPVTALVVGAALVAVQLAFAQAGTEEAVAAATPYAQWLALAINLVAVDILLRRPEASGGHRSRQSTRRLTVPSTEALLRGGSGARLPRLVPGDSTTTGRRADGIQVHEAFTFGAAPSPRG